jgi:hypothetical protein
MILRVVNPEDVPKFIAFFKAETANYLNRLLKRTSKTVWAERYDATILLDWEITLDKFVYTVLNPVKDGLVDSMQEYPGVSSYKYLQNNQNTIEVKSIPRDCVLPLKDPTRAYQEDHQYTQYFNSDKFQNITLHFKPEAIKLAFPETKDLSDEEIIHRLKTAVDEAQIQYQNNRGKVKPIGPTKLIKASMLKHHTPPKKGRKTLCLSTIPAIRKQFISSFKELCKKCTLVFQKWKKGFLHEPYPSGMFAPSQPRISNFLPSSLLPEIIMT